VLGLGFVGVQSWPQKQETKKYHISASLRGLVYVNGRVGVMEDGLDYGSWRGICLILLVARSVLS
jgi:hypothetical protein